MKQPSRYITVLTMALAMSAAVLIAGCVSPGQIAPTARHIDMAPAADAPASVDIGDTWWTGFGDEQLSALVERALAANPSLATARLRIERAAAVAGVADASRKPHVDGSLDITRARYSGQSAYSPVIAGTVKNSGSLFVTGGWEIDAFGRQRAALDAAVGSQRAAQADYQAARVLLASNIVRQYVQLARLVEQREVLERSLAQREEILGLTRRRVAIGLDTNVELRQSEGAVPEIRASIEAVREESSLVRHAIATLAGQGPDAQDELAPRLGKVVLVPLPNAIPADLLGRRADVVAARWRVESATSDLKAARAQFYPSINLVAFAGFTSIGLGNLIEAGSRQYGAGPAVRLPIFDAGRLRANYRGKATDVDIAVEAYNGTVLDALRETADALSLVQSIDRRQREQAQALASAQSAYELAIERFRGGLGSYLSVLAAETNVLAQRKSDNDLKAQALDAQVLLAHALGGGYVQA